MAEWAFVGMFVLGILVGHMHVVEQTKIRYAITD